MPELTLHFLGPPRIELDGQSIHLGRHKTVALLAYLALTHQPHARDALATLLWPDFDQSGARGQLRRTLSHLNRTLGDRWLDIDRETAAWADDAEAWIDVNVLRTRMQGCEAHGHPQQETCSQCIPLLAEGVELYRDGFLAGFTLPDAPGFDEWQFFEGQDLRDRVADALQRLAHWYGSQEEWDESIPYARRCLVLDPLHEPAHRELMRLYAQSGQRSAALRQYQECERLLGEELAVAPAPETTALYEAIRDRKDLTGLLNLSGLGLRDASAAPPRHNLPAQLTPFVGREQELAELEALLDPSSEARLVTVLGPGGIGKTRLALEAASRQVERYPDGVWFVPLASVQSPEAIASTVAQALGVSFFGPDPPARQLLRSLRNRRLLLVLDNLEHLLEGTGLLVDLLRAAPGIRIATTSRTRLNLTGEVVSTLGGMDYPKPAEGVSLTEDVRRHSSVVLFVRSARRADPKGFSKPLGSTELEHIARICQLAQGMPLAILLAAAWIPALSPSEIADEMERNLDFLAADWRDAPERHHSIRAVFDATWAMLEEKERLVFAKLSVFRGGFTREAAHAVADADLRTLMSLVNRSILQRDRSGRYEVHELLRRYGKAKLEETPEKKEEAFDLHAAYYAEFLARKEPDLRRGYLQASLREIDNIRAAWRRVTTHRRVAEIHKCLCSLWLLYQGFGLCQEGEPIFAEAIEALRPRPGEEVDDERAAAWGLALVMQGYFAAWFGHVGRAKACIEEGLSILCRLGERREVAVGNIVAVCSVDLGDASRARHLLEESLAISKKLDLGPDIILAEYNLAYVALHVDYSAAEQHAREALAVARQIDDRYGAGLALTMLGHIAYGRADYTQARLYYQEGLDLLQQTGHLWAVGRLCSHLGDVAMAVDDYEMAERYHRRALTRYQDLGFYWVKVSPHIGGSWGIPVSLQTLGDIALAVGNIEGTAQYYAQSLRTANEDPAPELLLQMLLGPARLFVRKGNLERAVEVAALAQDYSESAEETQEKAKELLDQLRDRLPADVYTAAEQRGRTRDLGATIQELLTELARSDA